jgi:peptidoglycan hydrolase-like protein with peptidoglycan-binding domain
MITRTRSTSLADLLSDAEHIAELPRTQQEQTIETLRREIENVRAELDTLQQSGASPTPYAAQTAQTMLSVLSQAREACPTCRAAQMPLPSLPVSAYGGVPMLPNTAMTYGVADNDRPLNPVTNVFGQTQNAPLPSTFPMVYTRAGSSSAPGTTPPARTTTAVAGSANGLAKGAKGSAVTKLQQLLKLAGYSVGVDGDFGVNTEKALKKFQQARGLAQDGVYKDVDANALQNAAGQKSGATQRAVAGKNNEPTPREQAMPIVETGLRIGVPLVAGGVAGFASWRGLKETNKQKKGAYSAAIGLGTALVTFIGTNLLADSLTAPTLPEQA